jgi:carboxypeptidase family protein
MWTALASRARLLAAAALLALAACVNPNAIGVQDSGSINGRVIDATTQQPIGGAIVSVNSLVNQTTNSGGVFLLQNVPVGVQTLTVYANGYQTTTVPNINVIKGQNSNVGLVLLTPAT